MNFGDTIQPILGEVVPFTKTKSSRGGTGLVIDETLSVGHVAFSDTVENSRGDVTKTVWYIGLICLGEGRYGQGWEKRFESRKPIKVRKMTNSCLQPQHLAQPLPLL